MTGNVVDYSRPGIRPVSELVAVLSALDPSPLHLPRSHDARVVGTCRHFATIDGRLFGVFGVDHAWGPA